MDFYNFFDKYIHYTKYIDAASLNIDKDEFSKHVNKIRRDYGLFRKNNEIVKVTTEIPYTDDEFANEYYTHPERTVPTVLKHHNIKINEQNLRLRGLWDEYGVLRHKNGFCKRLTEEEFKDLEKQINTHLKNFTKENVLKIINKHLEDCRVAIMYRDNEIRLVKDDKKKIGLYREQLARKRIETNKQNVLKQIHDEINKLKE